MQNEKFPNFSNFRPEFLSEFCSEFSPNFSRIFRALFPGKRRPPKIHQKSPPFFNAKSPGKVKEKIHKSLLESGQAKTLCDCLEKTVQSSDLLAVVSAQIALIAQTIRADSLHVPPRLLGQ